MKSEHRHDLETNWLAHHMASWIEKLKPHSTKLLVAVGIVAGLLLVGSISASVRTAKNKAAWEAYALALNTTDPEYMQLQQVAEEYPGTAMQEWAYATWADRQLQIAAGRYLVDRDAAKENLRKAQGYYESILQAGDPQILARAHLGLGRIYEMLNQVDKARSEYALVQGDLAPLAQERARQLESPEVQQVCQWLATAELPKRAPPNGSSMLGTSPGQPGFRPPFATTPPATTGDDQALKSIEELLGGPMTSAPTGTTTETDQQGSGQTEQETSENRYGEKTGSGEKASPKADDASTEETGPSLEDPSPKDQADTPTENASEDPAQANSEATAEQASKTKP